MRDETLTAMTCSRFVRCALAVLLAAPLPAASAAAEDRVAVIARAPSPERAAWFARYQDTHHGPASEETVTRTFKVGPGGSLDIFNLAGPIVVTGTGGDTIVVSAVKRVRGKAGDAKGQLDAVMIDVTETAGRVEVRTVARRSKNLSTWVDYSVQVPYGTSVAARSLAGDVKVSGVKGEVQIESASGTVEAVATPKLVRLKTLSGDIRIVDAASAAALLASTVSGNLTARGVKAQALELATVSGNLVLIDTSCERAQLRTMSGSLEFLGRLVKGGRYEFTSHAGDVRLKLVGKPGFELSAKSFSGDLHSDLPLEQAAGTGHDGPGPQRRDLRGTFGDGSALVIVKTFSGSVVVGRADKNDKKP